MSEPVVTITMRSQNKNTAILDIEGLVNASAETPLMNAYAQACEKGARSILLNFKRLEFMNSSGIGLLVTLLIRVKRQGQRLLACGLSEHYRQIFELTRLDEAIRIFTDENAALSEVGGLKEVASDG